MHVFTFHFILTRFLFQCANKSFSVQNASKFNSNNKNLMQHILESGFKMMNRPNENNVTKVRENFAIVYVRIFCANAGNIKGTRELYSSIHTDSPYHDYAAATYLFCQCHTMHPNRYKWKFRFEHFCMNRWYDISDWE